MQLHRHGEAVAYLHQRGLRSPELIEHMRIGYAPGSCLRGWLMRLSYALPALRQAGLVSAMGYDTNMHRIVLPVGRQSLWPEPVSSGAAASVFARCHGRPVFMGASPVLPGSDSRRGSVRLCGLVAGRFSQRHLLAGKPSQRMPVSPAVILMFAGFKSRCMMPFSCAVSRVSAICLARWRVSSTGIGVAAKRSARVGPSTNFADARRSKAACQIVY